MMKIKKNLKYVLNIFFIVVIGLVDRSDCFSEKKNFPT